MINTVIPAMVLAIRLFTCIRAARRREPAVAQKKSKHVPTRQTHLFRFARTACTVIFLCLSCISIGTRSAPTQHPLTSTSNISPPIRPPTAEIRDGETNQFISTAGPVNMIHSLNNTTGQRSVLSTSSLQMLPQVIRERKLSECSYQVLFDRGRALSV